ncbi:MAG: glycoside hydrolase family 11 protein [Micromonosporaceae bacterium]|nr:glycoside hydrolase family 11 protein [Micromonosporaceae bacterium]
MNLSSTHPVPGIRRRTKLMLIGGACAALLTAASLAVAGIANADPNLTVTSNSTGTHNGFFYTFWKDSGNVTMTLGAAGNYSLQWSNINDTVDGKGWNPGSSHTVNYSGSWNCNGNCYLALYGWTTNPLVEYYILDNYGSFNPGSQATHVGTVVSDGSTYDIYRDQRVNQPSIIGTATFDQYWSIRQSKRTGGTITTANHFNAWRNLGMTMGSFNYQVLATEGFQSSGSSNLTVSEGPGGGGTTPASPRPSTSPTNGGGGSGGCRVTNSVSSWNTGLTDNITVTNNGSAAVNGWSLKFTLASGQTITSGWNATYSPTSGQVTATNLSYNASIPAGGSTTIGFQATHTGNAAAPTGFSLNGTACS